MGTKVLPSLSSNSPPSLQRKFGPAQIFLHPAAPRRPQFLRAATGPSSSSSSNNDGTTPPPPPPPPPVMPSVTPPDTVEIRFRRGSRRRSKQLQQDRINSSSGGKGGQPKTPSPPKDWESMTMAEKAVELYMGEKGLLFWLNKFAYASIFIIIGAWILFRFVGPSLGLYQLESVPLSPSTILKGSS